MSRVLPIFLPLLLASCLVQVENPIPGDTSFDERLVGDWESVPMEAADYSGRVVPEEPPSEEDDAMAMRIAPDRAGTLRISSLEEGEDDEFTAATRTEGGRHYLLIQMEPTEGEPPGEEARGQLVLEYEFDPEGHLLLWIITIDRFSEAVDFHPLAHRKGEGRFLPPLHITATPGETLAFYADPEVARLLSTAGKFRRID